MRLPRGFDKRLPAVGLLLLSWRVVNAQPAAEQLYRQAREHLIEERYEQALALFRQVVAEHPTSAWTDDAQYQVGYTLELQGRHQEAIQAYEDLLGRWPDSPRVESARTHRAELLSLSPVGGADVLEEALSGSGSWELKQDVATALARSGHLSETGVLEDIMRRGSSSRQIELVGILEKQVSNPAARRILMIGLDPSRSTSVQLRALTALEPVAAEPDVIRAIEGILLSGGSSSVSLKAIQVLTPHTGQGSARQAIARGLEEGRSSSVQIAACSALSGHLLSPEVRPAVLRLFQTSTSSSVQMAALSGLEREKDRPELAEILRAAVSSHISSSVQLKATGIAESSTQREVRAVLREGLTSGVSTSVRLRAVEALGEGANDPASAEALENVLRDESTSTSVQLAALGALASHVETPAAGRAIAAALGEGHSTTVQLKAMDLAAGQIRRPEVRSAVVRILGDSSTSTSVQLKAVKLLSPDVADPQVREVLASALQPSNSTSVQLEVVAALDSQVAQSEVRRALVETLHRTYSTSVVLRSMEALDSFVAKDPGVGQAYIRLMEDDEMASTCRVRAAERLLPNADADLRQRIAEAMEDVIVHLNQEGRRFHGDLLEEALDVLRAIDPSRAERLAGRRRQ